MKEKEIDKDTVVAYHEYMQGRIREELNGVFLGPVAWLGKIVIGLVIFGLVCLVTGILVISLRYRHVYLWDWNDEFIGPFFVIMFFLCVGVAVFLTVEAKRRANAYRRDVAFRPIGDYGVAVVHKSKLSYDFQERDALKSGSGTPRAAGRHYPVSYDPQGRGQRRDDRGPRVHGRPGYDNRGYREGDPRRYQGGRGQDRPPRYEDSEKGRAERDEDRRRYEERRRYEDRRRQEGRDDDRRRPEGRRPEDDDRRPEGRRPEDDDRRRYEEDRRRREGRRPEGEGRRPEGEGRRPEDDDKRRYEEYRRRREQRPEDDEKTRRPDDDERRQEEPRRYGRRGEPRDVDRDMERRRPPPDAEYRPPGPGPHGQPPRVNLAKELDDTGESEL